MTNHASRRTYLVLPISSLRASEKQSVVDVPYPEPSPG